MAAYLQKVFRVLPEEVAKVLLVALFAALLQAGVAVGMTSADSLFLTHLGAEKLPIVYLCMPVIMAVYAPVYSVLQMKLGMERMVHLTLVLLFLGGLFFGLSGELLGRTGPWLFYTMKFYVGLWFIALYTLFWNYVDDYFSILDGKRLYGLIAAGGAAGATAGAALVTGMSRLVPPGRLFLAWSVLAVLTLPVLAVLKRRFPRVEVVESDHAEDPSPTALIRFAFGALKRSPFALALAGACFFGVNLAAILEYLAMGVFAHDKNPAELAQLLGPLYAIANIVALLVNLFIYNRLVGRIGVANTALVLPLAFLAAFAAFFLHHGFVAALIGFYAYQSLLASIEYNNVNVLFNAMPAASKRPLRTFVEALAEPAATALAGAFLLAWATGLGSSQVSLTGLIASLAALATAFLVRRGYGLALADNLRRDWLDFTPAPEHWHRRLSDEDRALLRQKALSSSDRGERIMATDLLGYTGDSEAGNALASLVGSARPSEAELLRPAVSRILRSNDTAAVASVLLWLESDQSPEDPELLDEFACQGALPVRHLRAWGHSRHPARVAMSAVARWHGGRLDDAADALAEVQRLLSEDAASRRWGIRALGGFGHAPHAITLLPFLDEPDAELRLEALRALLKLATPDASAVLARVLPLLEEGTPDERQLILGIAENVGSVTSLSPILVAARHFSVVESRQFEALIVSLGPRAIAALIHGLRDPTLSSHARTIAARALARIARPQLELIADDLITTELGTARDLALNSQRLAGLPGAAESDGVSVLKRFYHDSGVDGLNYVLQLLGLTNRLPDVELLQASLLSASAKERANAIETIEQSCPRELFLQLRPLLPDEQNEAKDSEEPTAPATSVETLLRQASSSDDALECTAALLAFQELRIAGGRELLRRRLDECTSERMTRLLAQLLPIFEPGLREATSAGIHPVQRVAALTKSSLFSGAPVSALEYLAARSAEEVVPAGKTLYQPRLPCADLLVLVSGAASLERPDGTVPLRRGDSCNDRALLRTLPWPESATSDGCTVLAIPGFTITRAIEIFPSLGMSLYRARIVQFAR